MSANRLIYLPLGGAGEIGMNAYVYGYGPKGRERLILVDLGVAFPDMDTSPGVDLILPDVSWLADKLDRLEAIFITHAHEDHIGALAPLWPRLQKKVYCRRFTATIGRLKFDEAGLPLDQIVVVEPRPATVEVGPFKVQFVPVSHSIPESSALVIDTPAGRIFHSADFKIDHTPVVGEGWDDARIAEIVAERPVKAMTCDSTNVFSTHEGRSEATLAEPLTELIRSQSGMVVATTFGSNVARLKTLALAARARGQIRRPLGQAAQVTITVVDTNGEVLGLVRAPDAPIFGTDVALQKARSAAFMSNPVAGAELLALPAAVSPLPMATSAMGPYVTALRSFMGNAFTLSNGVALSTKAIGNLSRPFFPDGIIGTPNGPLSKPYAQWSPFSDGMQLDISINAIVKAAFGDLGVGCTGLNRLRNGLQIFSGGMPIYRVVNGTAQLLGGIGVSGDGTDQDDMIAFLGLAQAGAVLGNGIGNAPPALRADAIPLSVGRLRYVQCPVAPFNDSNAQNVCTGL